MSNGLTKYEVSAVAQKAGCAWLHEPLAQRFATLCRAPLVAEVERLKKDLSTYDKRIVALSCIAMEDVHELLALQAELADWKARALKAEQAGEPFGWYSAKEDDFMLDKIRKTHERLNSHTHRIGKYDTALFTAPQPAAQEPFAWARPDAVDASQDFRFIKIDDFTVPLYATPPSAVPVVEQLVEALKDAQRAFSPAIHVGVSSAIAAGQQYLKENGK